MYPYFNNHYLGHNLINVTKYTWFKCKQCNILIALINNVYSFYEIKDGAYALIKNYTCDEFLIKTIIE